MAFENFKPELWSDMILDNLDKELVFGALANRQYEGQIQGKGTSVRISEIGDVTVNNYTGDDINYEDLDDASKYLLIDQEKYAAVQLDDVDKIQATPELVGKLSQRIAYGLGNVMDSFIAGKYTEAGVTSGSTGSVTTITSANVISNITGIAKLLDQADVPSAGRVMVVPPWYKEKMVLAKIIRDTDNSADIQNGMIKADYLGFEFHMSNNISYSGTSWWAPMFFIKGFTIGFVQQLYKVEAMRSQDSFKDLIRALSVYGGKVIQPKSLGVAYVKPGSETTI